MRNILFGCLVFCGVLILPSLSRAQAPFGGLQTFTFPCTCSPIYTWGFFAPLFLGTAVPVAGALATPLVVEFPFYAPRPGAYDLGFYTPGVQACYLYVVFGCIPLPTIGVITPFTGVSGP